MTIFNYNKSFIRKEKLKICKCFNKLNIVSMVSTWYYLLTVIIVNIRLYRVLMRSSIKHFTIRFHYSSSAHLRSLMFSQEQILFSSSLFLIYLRHPITRQCAGQSISIISISFRFFKPIVAVRGRILFCIRTYLWLTSGWGKGHFTSSFKM